MEYLLTLIIVFPAAAAFMSVLIHGDVKLFAVIMSGIELILVLILYSLFDPSLSEMQFVHQIPVIPTLGINYLVGIDGISLFLVILASLISFIGFIFIADIHDMRRLVVSLLFLESIMIGVFLALDSLLFYFFWEISLVPMFYIIGVWGSGKKIYTALKFFLYTFAGSLMMLIGILYMAFAYHEATGMWSFSLLDWQLLVLPIDLQKWLFLAFFLGVAVKVPMFPFHTWLPYAHGQAPTIGSVILAAVLLKMGTYGFVRLILPFFPDASFAFAVPMAILAVIMVIYGAMLAYAQEDMKQVIAYSSISHMGVIMMGIFSLNIEGVAGSLFFMISHGLISGALFMMIGVIYDRFHTKRIVEIGGLTQRMPVASAVFGVLLMASVGLPLTMGFVGEFLSLLGFFQISPWLVLLAGSSVVLGSVYMLSLFRRLFFGEEKFPDGTHPSDLSRRELTAILPLVAIVIWLGVYPKPILAPLDVGVRGMIELMEEKASLEETKSYLRLTLGIKGE